MASLHPPLASHHLRPECVAAAGVCVLQVQAYKSYCDYEKQLSEAQAYLKEVQGDPEMAEFAREEIADLQVGNRQVLANDELDMAGKGIRLWGDLQHRSNPGSAYGIHAGFDVYAIHTLRLVRYQAPACWQGWVGICKHR
jgi:hypothetical protein